MRELTAQGEEVCSNVMALQRNKQRILPGRSLIGDITLDLSRGRKELYKQKGNKGERSFQAEGTAHVLIHRLVNEYVMNEDGRYASSASFAGGIMNVNTSVCIGQLEKGFLKTFDLLQLMLPF